MANEKQGTPPKNLGNPGGRRDLKSLKSRWERGSKKFGNPGGRGGQKCCHPWGVGWIFSGITQFSKMAGGHFMYSIYYQ